LARPPGYLRRIRAAAPSTPSVPALPTLAARLQDNLSTVRARIDAAATRAGRSPGSVRLVAVTKQVDAATCGQLAALGQHDLGESRAQALGPKAAWCAAHGVAVRWHFLGHLQRNKVRAVVCCAEEIHSIDSLRLLEAVERVAAEEGRRPRVYLEVDFTSIDERTGLRADDVPALVAAARAMEHVELAGLMTMAPPPAERAADPLAAARAAFTGLAELRERLPGEAFVGGQAALSMGMSSDFELAVECGADVVRVGTLLFEGLALEDPASRVGGGA